MRENDGGEYPRVKGDAGPMELGYHHNEHARDAHNLVNQSNFDLARFSVLVPNCLSCKPVPPLIQRLQLSTASWCSEANHPEVSFFSCCTARSSVYCMYPGHPEIGTHMLHGGIIIAHRVLIVFLFAG